MRIGVLIDNYNYARFLEGCLASVLAQTREADEIVVVDDGSTDGSRELLERLSASHPTAPIHLVFKPNGGQLSAFNAGAAVATADVVCFLDSDDEFEPGYLAEVERCFRADSGLDVLYTAHTRVFEDGRRLAARWRDGRLPPQRLESVVLLKYAGGPTSTIAVSGPALRRILPAGDEPAWRVSADDVLVMKAAANGMARRNCARPLVRYRIHGSNLFHGRSLPAAELKRRRARRLRLLAPDIAALNALPPGELAALYRDEIRQTPRSAVAMWRRALLVLRLPVRARLRPRLAWDFLAWCLLGPRA